MNEQQFQKIQAKYGDEYLFRQLAEECIELAHASLKLIRAMRGETPLSIEKARASFLKEASDVRGDLRRLRVACREALATRRKGENTMAEFSEVMKHARRMCGSISCDNCILPRNSDEMCIWEDAPSGFTDEVIAEIEAKTLKWAAENPEVRYPTWREWQQEHFRDGANMIRPCEFMSGADAHCFDYMYTYGCSDCANQPIPADVAEKLGIKPITKTNSG